MKAKRLLLVVLLCVLIVVALLLVTTAASASHAPRAQFGAQARGECLLYPLVPGLPAYFEEASGRLTVHGQGLYTGPVDFPWKGDGSTAYVLDPSNVSGSVQAAWTHDGVSYELRARLYDTPVTKTFFKTEEPFLLLFVGLHPAEAELSYSGTLAVGAERSHVEGTCEIGAGPCSGDLLMSFVFNLPGNWPWGFTLTWAKDGGWLDFYGAENPPIFFPGADSFNYWVNAR